MLCFLSEHCDAAQGANRLKYLVSKPGKEAYQKLALSSNVSLIDLLFHRASRCEDGAFRLPEDLAKPLVLIGSVTVPFVGFLEHKRELSKVCPTVMSLLTDC